MSKENYFDIAQIAVKAIDSKRGEDIEVIRVSDITVLTDFFVIATATSNTQLKAIADEIEYKLSQAGYEPHHTEGEKSEWICLDYAGCVIHILLKQQRGFYQIENLWRDGEKVNIDGLIIKE